MTELVNRIGAARLIQIALEVWNSLFLVIIVLLLLIDRGRKSSARYRHLPKIPLTRELIFLCSAIFFYSMFDVLSICFDGVAEKRAAVWKYIGEYGFYLTGWVLLAFFLWVLKSQFKPDVQGKTLRRWLTGLQILQLVNLVLLALSPALHILFVIDGQNRYARGRYYFIWNSIVIVTLLSAACICILYRDRLSKFMRRLFAAVAAVQITAAVCNYFTYQISLHCIGAAVIALTAFVLYEINRTEIIMDSIYQNEKLSSGLMLSQIQPHFIQNALTSMIYFADKDAAKTKNALMNFSQYMRRNLDISSMSDPVPFSEELTHVKTYLALEQMRFEDDLQVQYDIGPTAFMLPPLTVQPLVENAVKHGIMRSERGCGTVTLRTAETADDWQIIISDDGCGFDPKQLETLDQTHIGIRNVKRRLELFCGGTLQFTSSPGKGTVCTVSIPKGREHNENSGD